MLALKLSLFDIWPGYFYKSVLEFNNLSFVPYIFFRFISQNLRIPMSTRAVFRMSHCFSGLGKLLLCIKPHIILKLGNHVKNNILKYLHYITMHKGAVVRCPIHLFFISRPPTWQCSPDHILGPMVTNFRNLEQDHPILLQVQPGPIR